MKPTVSIDEVELAYRSTQESVNSLAKRFGMSEPTLRRLVKKNGWIRCAPESKRRVVADAMAGVTKGLTNDEVRQAQENAASEDIADMAQGIRVFRNVLGAMETASQSVEDPRDAKVITEATEKAINGIRNIRGLDDPASDNEIVVTFPDSE